MSREEVESFEREKNQFYFFYHLLERILKHVSEKIHRFWLMKNIDKRVVVLETTWFVFFCEPLFLKWILSNMFIL